MGLIGQWKYNLDEHSQRFMTAQCLRSCAVNVQNHTMWPLNFQEGDTIGRDICYIVTSLRPPRKLHLSIRSSLESLWKVLCIGWSWALSKKQPWLKNWVELSSGALKCFTSLKEYLECCHISITRRLLLQILRRPVQERGQNIFQI